MQTSIFHNSPEQEEIKCKLGHSWNGVVPEVDPSIHEIQHPELINTPCDCGKALYDEKLCGCSIKKWEVKLKENS